MKKSLSLTVGELAKATGVHVETVRYYQRRGLLATPERRLTPGGGGCSRLRHAPVTWGRSRFRSVPF